VIVRLLPQPPSFGIMTISTSLTNSPDCYQTITDHVSQTATGILTVAVVQATTALHINTTVSGLHSPRTVT